MPQYRMTKLERKGYPPNWRMIVLALKAERGSSCENCGTVGEKRNPLTTHHIDYKPSNCSRDNLIILCAKCHLQLQAIDRVKSKEN